MRSIITLCAVILLCALTSGQAGFGHGHPDWTPPGSYSEPFKPLLTTPFVALDSVGTPSISLDPVTPSVGASNATAGSAVVFAQPAWYGSQTTPEVKENASSPENEESRPAVGFNFGAGSFQSNYGAAQLLQRPNATQARLYTNPDVVQVNQTNGLVKYRGRKEHLD